MSPTVHEHVLRAQVLALCHAPDLQEPGAAPAYNRPQRASARPARHVCGWHDRAAELPPTLCRHCARHGRSWRPEPTEEVCRQRATTPAWWSAQDWLTRLSVAVATPQGEAARAAAKVSRATMMAVAAVDARTADHRTGRDVQTAHATVARALGCCAKTVQRARQLMEALGFARTIELGRYLTAPERVEAHSRHGGHQLRMASDRVLTMPRIAYQHENVHLPRRGQSCGSVTSVGRTPTRADARAGGAPRPSATTRKGPRPTLAMQRLAARLAARLPWLAHRHLWALCRTLAAVGIQPEDWTAGDLVNLLDRRNADRGLYSLAPTTQRDPLALLAHQLRDALAQVTEAPGARRAREAAERAQAAQQARADREALAAQLAAEREDPQVQARVAAAKAQIRATLAAARNRARY